MSKNMTRKGLAFGAGLALVSSGLVASPAIAAVDNNAVSLVPLAGTDYKVDLGNSFDLKSDQSLAAVNGSGKLKFLVADPDKEVLFDFDADGATDTDTLQDITLANADTLTIAAGAGAADLDTFTITNAADDADYNGLQVGDLITISGLSATGGGKDLTSLNGTTQVIDSITNFGGGNVQTVVFKAVTSIASEGAAALEVAGDANKITEKSLSDALDTVANIKLGALGVGGDPGITAPTRAADGSFVINTNTDSAATTQELRLVSTSTDAHTVTVTAWIDENGNGEIDATEDASSTRTVTFVKLADTGMQLNLTAPEAAGTAYKATISFNSDVNVAQMTASRFNVGLGRVNPSGTIANGTTNAFGTGDSTSYDSDNDVLTIGANGVNHTYGAIDFGNEASTVTVTAAAQPAVDAFVIADADAVLGAFVAGDVLTFADESLDTNGNGGGAGDIQTAIGGTVTLTSASSTELKFSLDTDTEANVAGVAASAGQAKVVTFTPGVTYAAQIVADGTAQGTPTYSTVGAANTDAVGKAVPTRSENVRLSAGNDWLARSSYTGDVTFTSAITKGGSAVGAGVAATVRVTRTALDADSTITAGGKTLTSTTADGYIEFAATTDADGNVSFTVSNDVGKDSDKISVTVKSDGITSTAQTLEWKDLTAANTVLVVNGNTPAANKSTARVTIEAGGSVTMNFEARDEYGALLTGDYRLTLDLKSKKVGGNGSLVAVDMSTGKGSYTFTDASTTTGNYTVEGTIQKLNTTTLQYANYGDPEEADTVVTVVASAAASAVSITATADTDAGDYPAVETVTGVAVNGVLDPNAGLNDAPAYNADEEYTISGIVTGTGGVALPGATVTLSGANLLFKVGNVYTIGSATVEASAAGAYSGVEVRSNIAGDQTLTVTSGAASNTKTLTFDAAASTAGTSLVVTAPAEVKPGTTVTYSAKLTDKFGNPVDTGAVMKATYTGPGSTVPSTLPNETDADGIIKFNVQVGAADTGSMEVTFSYDQNADADYKDAKDLVETVSNTIYVAPAPAAVDSVMVTGVAEVVAGETATFTATITDEDGNALAGRTVTLSEAGVGEITALTGVTDANGQVSTLLVTSSVGNSYITATSEGKSHTLLVKVVNPVPGQVTGLTATAGEESIALSWTAATGVVADYKVEWTTDGETWNVYADGVSDDTSVTISDLTAGTEYTFRVSASNSTGSGAVSSSASATPTAPVVEEPVVEEPVGKVNVGTFNGKVVVFALGLEGSTVSWKIAGKWQKVEVTDDALQRYDRPTAAIGAVIKVDIYVDGELRLSKTVTTK